MNWKVIQKRAKEHYLKNRKWREPKDRNAYSMGIRAEQVVTRFYNEKPLIDYLLVALRTGNPPSVKEESVAWEDYDDSGSWEEEEQKTRGSWQTHSRRRDRSPGASPRRSSLQRRSHSTATRRSQSQPPRPGGDMTLRERPDVIDLTAGPDILNDTIDLTSEPSLSERLGAPRT